MYQQVWPIADDTKTSKIIKPHKKTPKTTTGYMNCKRRSKKCDEVKTACNRCCKSKIRCFWSGHVSDAYKAVNGGVLLTREEDHDEDNGQIQVSVPKQVDKSKEKVTTDDKPTGLVYCSFIEETIPVVSSTTTSTTKNVVKASQNINALITPGSPTAEIMNDNNLNESKVVLFDLRQFMDGFTMDTDLFDIGSVPIHPERRSSTR